MKASPGAFRRLRDRSRAHRDGKRDGLLGIPTSSEVAYPPALMSIAQRADEAVAELVRWWAGEDARLHERIGTSTRELRTFEEYVQNATADLTEAEQQRRTTQALRDDFVAQPTSTGPRISPRVYVVAIIAILLAEFPLNAIAFRLFGEAEVLTWVMTASLAVTLILCAHGLGTFLRIAHPSMAERRWIVVLVVLPLLAIVAIAVIRARYLSLEAQVTGLDVLGPVVGSLAFLVINLLVYTGATMFSYLAHAPRTLGSDELTGAAQGAERDLVAARERLAEASRRARWHQELQDHAGVEAEEALRVARVRARGLLAYHRGLMTVYCAANLRARGNPEVHPVLRELPAIEVPSALREEPATEVPAPDQAASGNGRVSEAGLASLRPGSDVGAVR